MFCRSQHTWPLAAAALLATLAPSLAGEWCENFEADAGMFWAQRSSSGQWQHTTYTDLTSQGSHIPEPATGEEGVLLLQPPLGGAAASSHLVSPELVFSQGAAIQIDYWLHYTGPREQTPVRFQLYRLVNQVEDKEPFLDITFYSNGDENKWSTIQAGLNLDKGEKIRVAIYGYAAGSTNNTIALDRVVLLNVNDNKACDEVRFVAPTAAPGPEGPHFDFFCPTEYGLYMDPGNCSFYYSCNSWMAIHMPCYTDLVFNPGTTMCDYPKFVPGCP